MKQIVFTVPGTPVGKGRPRFARRGNFVSTYTPAKTVSYENLVKLAAEEAMAGTEPMKRPVALTLTICMPIPQSWSKKRKEAALCGLVGATTKPDWDNVGKLAADAMNGIVYTDDKQIVRATIIKQYGTAPHVAVCPGICGKGTGMSNKHWSPEHIAILMDRYETAPTIDEVAAMVGRTRMAVNHKAWTMGLSRPGSIGESATRLLSALGDEPKTAAEVAEALGVRHSSAASLLKRSDERGVCHVVGNKAHAARGRGAPLWAAKGKYQAIEKAPLVKASANKLRGRPKNPQTVVIVRRHPQDVALFGKAPDAGVSAVPGRVIAQPMDERDDELEAA